MHKNFYITTPIYYPSAKPHMGHAYSSVIADFFARFKKIDGFNVHFVTGTDEHGLKIQRAAEKDNMTPLEFCNKISKTFKDLSKTFIKVCKKLCDENKVILETLTNIEPKNNES